MITEKLMMPYVLASQHRIMHMALFWTLVATWLSMRGD